MFRKETAFETEASGYHAWEAYFMFKKREKTQQTEIKCERNIWDFYIRIPNAWL